MDSSDETKPDFRLEDDTFTQLRLNDEKINRHRLIHLVKTHPCIWDRDNDHYNEKTKKDKAWNAICAGLDSAFSKRSKTRQYQLRIHVTKKWNNLRDSYRKYLKGKRNKPYVYSNQLSFLDSVFNVKKEVADDTEADPDNEKYEVTWLEDNVMEADDDLNEFNSTSIEEPIQTEERNEHVITVLSNLIQKEEDEDRLFLKSLLPSVRSLKEDTKMEFRIQVMKLIKHLKNKDRQRKKQVSNEDWMSKTLKEESD